MLSIAYASNIGGTGTLTGTGTNLILQGLLDDMYPDSSEVTFATWFYYAAPGMLIAIAMAWCVLNILYLSGTAKTSKEQENRIKTLICKKYEELGTPSFQEMAVSLLFLVVVFLWLFRDPKFMPGWTSYLPSTIKVKDATPVILVALFMFLIPANFGQFTDGQTKKVATLLDWPTVQKRVPWGAILLLGGGLALAEGTKKSGLSHWLGTELMFLKSYSPFQALCILTTVVAFLTEVTSNVATASVVLPVVNQIALTMNANPLFLMVPTTVAVSFAFMLPVATPPNALVFESLDMRVIDMVKPGLVMNILCILLQILLVNTWGVFVFNFNQFPEWAQTQNTTISMH
ncbi:Solute carrier family 13 member 5 [Halotydeus destructor]|nr:Solute carrier family 13 member 5 [Halotydeus destructor]